MTEQLKSGSDTGNELPSTEVAGTSPVSLKKLGTFASLLVPSFRMLLIGSVFANAIQWIQQVTLSWLVYDLTTSGTILGSINLVCSLASLLVIPVAGLLIDRFSRRKLMMIENGWLFTITFLLGLLLVLGNQNISYLFIFAFLCSIAQTIDMTLRQVLIFDLVPRSHAPNAVALIQTGWSLMRVIGPSVGGFLIIWVGAGGSFLVQAGIYVLIAITILMIKFPVREPELIQSSPLQNIRVGIQFVVQNRTTRTFILMGIIMPLLAIPIFSILPPIYAVQVFGDESGKVLGFLMASVGVGGILGGVVTASLRRFEHWGRLQLTSLFLLSATLIAFAFSSNLPVALIFMALAGFFEIIFLTTNQTMIQLSIPDSLRGRVTAVINLTWILSPLGSLMAGIGSDLLGGPKMITIVLASMTVGVTFFVLLFSSTVRNYRLTQGMTSSSTKVATDLGL